jgi:hypothetical protein
MKRILVLVALSLFAAVGLAGTAAAATVRVSDGTPGWTRGDTRPPGIGVFQPGPPTPPAGIGSFRLTTPTPTAKVQLMTTWYTGMRISAIQGIGYWTYRYLAPPASPALPALNLRVDLNGDGVADRYMVYEPYQDQGNAAVQDLVWQRWDAYRGGAAIWWLSGTGPCDQGHPCTWNQILALYPNATLREGPLSATALPGTLGVNQGSNNAGLDAAADALWLTIGGFTITHDFEPVGGGTGGGGGGGGDDDDDDHGGGHGGNGGGHGHDDDDDDHGHGGGKGGGRR